MTPFGLKMRQLRAAKNVNQKQMAEDLKMKNCKDWPRPLIHVL